eukprot:Awhi_evm1s7229
MIFSFIQVALINREINKDLKVKKQGLANIKQRQQQQQQQQQQQKAPVKPSYKQSNMSVKTTNPFKKRINNNDNKKPSTAGHTPTLSRPRTANLKKNIARTGSTLAPLTKGKVPKYTPNSKPKPSKPHHSDVKKIQPSFGMRNKNNKKIQQSCLSFSNDNVMLLASDSCSLDLSLDYS